MKFSCEKHVLQSAIVTAQRAAASKSPIPALEGLLIEAGRQVRITGYDLKRGIYTSIPADVTEPGSIILNARLFGEIVRSLPDGVVHVSSDMGYMTRITCGSADFSIMGFDSDDYPDLPDADGHNAITIRQDLLRDMVGRTLFAVSDNEARPVYTGSLFEVENGKLTVVSVDGYRLALRRGELIASDFESTSFIVPGTALGDVEKICTDSEEPVRITVGLKHISFAIDSTVVVSRRLEGEFLNYRRSIPAEFKYRIKAARTELTRVVDRVSLIIDAKTKNPLRCTFGDGELKLVCVTNLGKAEDVCPVEGSGAGLEIGFNNRYLLDALRAAPADELQLCVNTGSSPCVILPADGSDGFVFMILPVRLRAGE